MATTVTYRFLASLDNLAVVEIEYGDADWAYIRRQAHKLADERNEKIILDVYNDNCHRWDFIGRALPGGDWFNFNGSGPYVLSADGNEWRRKGGEK